MVTKRPHPGSGHATQPVGRPKGKKKNQVGSSNQQRFLSQDRGSVHPPNMLHQLYHGSSAGLSEATSPVPFTQQPSRAYTRTAQFPTVRDINSELLFQQHLEQTGSRCRFLSYPTHDPRQSDTVIDVGTARQVNQAQVEPPHTREARQLLLSVISKLRVIQKLALPLTILFLIPPRFVQVPP